MQLIKKHNPKYLGQKTVKHDVIQRAVNEVVIQTNVQKVHLPATLSIFLIITIKFFSNISQKAAMKKKVGQMVGCSCATSVFLVSYRRWVTLDVGSGF